MKRTWRVPVFSPDTGNGSVWGHMRSGDYMRSLRSFAAVNPVGDHRRIDAGESLAEPRLVEGRPWLLGRAGNAWVVAFVFSQRRMAMEAARVLFCDSEAFSSWVAVALHQKADGSIEQVKPPEWTNLGLIGAFMGWQSTGGQG